MYSMYVLSSFVAWQMVLCWEMFKLSISIYYLSIVESFHVEIWKFIKHSCAQSLDLTKQCWWFAFLRQDESFWSETNLLILLMLPHFAWPCQLGPRRVTMRAAPESGAAQLSGSKALFVKGFVSSRTDRFTDLGSSGYPWHDIRLFIYLHEVIVP